MGVTARRLAAQRIASGALGGDPGAVVAWLGAVQAQDYPAAFAAAPPEVTLPLLRARRLYTRQAPIRAIKHHAADQPQGGAAPLRGLRHGGPLAAAPRPLPDAHGEAATYSCHLGNEKTHNQCRSAFLPAESRAAGSPGRSRERAMPDVITDAAMRQTAGALTGDRTDACISVADPGDTEPPPIRWTRAAGDGDSKHSLTRGRATVAFTFLPYVACSIVEG